jgi:predicted nucleic acid-binding protein
VWLPVRSFAGEILFGIARLPAGRRRTELEETGRQFLAAFRCEPVPERAGDFYSAVKLARQQRGLTLDENDLWVAATALALGATLVSRDGDFAGIDGLPVVAPAQLAGTTSQGIRPGWRLYAHVDCRDAPTDVSGVSREEGPGIELHNVNNVPIGLWAEYQR